MRKVAVVRSLSEGRVCDGRRRACVNGSVSRTAERVEDEGAEALAEFRFGTALRAPNGMNDDLVVAFN